MVKPEDIHEQHRKYLEIKDNPKKVTTSAIFKLVSDEMIGLNERMAVLETKQDHCAEHICTLDKRVEKATDELDREQRDLRAEFKSSVTIGAKNDAKFEERFTWQDRMQKVILTVLVSLFGFLLFISGIPITIP